MVFSDSSLPALSATTQIESSRRQRDISEDDKKDEDEDEDVDLRMTRAFKAGVAMGWKVTNANFNVDMKYLGHNPYTVRVPKPVQA
jgi:hypothetical protein